MQQSMEQIKKTGENQELESRFVQMLVQNDLWAWEIDLERRAIINYDFLKGRNPYGYSEKIIENVPDSIIERGTIYKDDVARYRRMYERIKEGEKQVSIQVRLWLAARQEYCWQQVTMTVIHDVDGRPVRALCSSRDISEAKQMERRFLEESRHWEEISASKLATGRRNLTTGRWEEITIHGMSITWLEEMQQVDYRARARYFLFEVAISDEDNQKLAPEYLIHQYARGICNSVVEYNAQTMESGEPVRVRVDCRVLKRPETGDLIAFYYESDITQEYCVRSIMNSIIHVEYDLVGVLFAATNSIFSKGKENKTALPQLKSSNYDEACEQFFKEQASANIGDVNALLQSTQLETVLKKLATGDTYIVEFDVREPNGEVRRKELRYSYISREEQMIAVSRRDVQDIVTEERRRQEQLEQALNFAEQANNAKSEFLSRMSHEMRTPMNAIMGLVTLAEQELNDTKAVRDYLDKMKTSSRFLLNLINDVLDMAKIENGKVELHEESCCYVTLMEGIENVIEPLCEQKGIRFVVEGEKKRKAIMVDRLRFQQVCINLLSNAVKFTPPDGEIYFKYDARQEKERLVLQLEVADNGVGMSEEFQKQMFQPFTQEQRGETVVAQGTGLGLAITKAIIDKMGGDIQVISNIGAGTRFLIRLDFLMVEDICTIKNEEPLGGEVQTDCLEGKKILLVEDHPMNQLIARRILQNNGMRVMTVENGAEAVDIFGTEAGKDFDAVLMDIRMPVMDGITATKRIRELPNEMCAKIPIIAMTANAFDEDVKRSKEAGMNDHLAKPIETELLLQTLRKWITENGKDK